MRRCGHTATATLCTRKQKGRLLYARRFMYSSRHGNQQEPPKAKHQLNRQPADNQQQTKSKDTAQHLFVQHVLGQLQPTVLQMQMQTARNSSPIAKRIQSAAQGKLDKADHSTSHAGYLLLPIPDSMSMACVYLLNSNTTCSTGSCWPYQCVLPRLMGNKSSCRFSTLSSDSVLLGNVQRRTAA